MTLEIAPGTVEALERMDDIFVVLAIPGDGDRAARVLASARDDLYWLDTPPEEDGERMIPSLVTDVRRLTADSAFVMLDAGDADPDLLGRIPAIIERHLDAAGGGQATLRCTTELSMDAGEPWVPSAAAPATAVPAPPKPESAKRPPIPPRPPGAAELASAYWGMDPFLEPMRAVEFSATALTQPLLGANRLPAQPMVDVIERMPAGDPVKTLLELGPWAEDVFSRLAPHQPVTPESRDPLVWSGIDAALDAVAYVRKPRLGSLVQHALDRHADGSGTIDLVVRLAFAEEAMALLNATGFRAWGDWIGRAAHQVRGGDEASKARAEGEARNAAILEVMRWLIDPEPEVEPRRRRLIDRARELAHGAVSPFLATQRDEARRRAATAAALALLSETARRAASAISRDRADPYSPLSSLGAGLVAATTALLDQTTPP